MLQVSYQPPSLHGVDWSNPGHVMQYEMSQNEAIRRALQEIQRQGNNPKYILVNGKPLDKAISDSEAWPGDIKWFHGSLTKAKSFARKHGWTVCDGSNGTEDMLTDQLFIRSAGVGQSSGATGGTECHAHTLGTGCCTGNDDPTHKHTTEAFGVSCTDVCHRHTVAAADTAAKDVCHRHSVSGLPTGGPSATETVENDSCGSIVDVASCQHTHTLNACCTTCTSISHCHNVAEANTCCTSINHCHDSMGVDTGTPDVTHCHSIPAVASSCVSHLPPYVEYIPLMKK